MAQQKIKNTRLNPGNIKLLNENFDELYAGVGGGLGQILPGDAGWTVVGGLASLVLPVGPGEDLEDIWAAVEFLRLNPLRPTEYEFPSLNVQVVLDCTTFAGEFNGTYKERSVHFPATEYSIIVDALDHSAHTGSWAMTNHGRAAVTLDNCSGVTAKFYGNFNTSTSTFLGVTAYYGTVICGAQSGQILTATVESLVVCIGWSGTAFAQLTTDSGGKMSLVGDGSPATCGPISVADGGLFLVNGNMSATGTITVSNLASIVVDGNLTATGAIAANTGGTIGVTGTVSGATETVDGVTAVDGVFSSTGAVIRGI